uniref:Uncharacterized protein n=1 Tax=Rhizophora mucronata TaxID=61149 RepID=A0A2P2N6Z6_RHIMU
MFALSGIGLLTYYVSCYARSQRHKKPNCYTILSGRSSCKILPKHFSI